MIGDGVSDTGPYVLVDTQHQSASKPPNNHTSLNGATITDVGDFNKESLVDASHDGNVQKPPTTQRP
jgi:hypothetical protein